MKQLIKSGYVLLEAGEGMVLHKAGEGYGPKEPSRQATVPSVEAAGVYEELTEEEYATRRLAEYKSRAYKDRLSAAVHERYSVEDKIDLALSINAPMALADDDKAAAVAEEWADYLAYRAECEERVRAEVEAITEVPDGPDHLALQTI